MSDNTSVATNSTADIVREIISFFKTDILNNESAHLSEDDQIISQGLIDSMGIIRLLTRLQNLYGIKNIDNKDLTLDNFRTIGHIAAMIARYR